MKGYPVGFPRLLLCTVAAIFITGVLLIPSALFYRLDWEMVWKLGGGTRNLVGAIHVAVGLLITALLGAVWTIHIRHHWRMKQNRFTGVNLTVVLVLLGITGIGCMYLGGEWSAPASSIAHIILGVALPFIMTVHIILGKRITKAHGPFRPTTGSPATRSEKGTAEK